MEVPISEEEGALMEWAPYTNLINQIPLKVQSGLFSHDLNLTCIDATNEYLAIGTNIGLVFWYGRQKGDLQRLRCEVSSSPITFVRIVSTVDFMVAAGNKVGQVTVFQIPKTHPESLPESLKPKVARQVERYTVGDLHHAQITFIEWSKNGMRLFSGDKNGLVVMTEIDFYMHLCKSSEIINESYEIVQISYYQNYLLVSSVYRCIICHKNDAKWDVNQVGKRDRKSLSHLGGVFHHNYEKPNDVNIYCARPGLRIWTSDRQGNVLQTLLFKEAIANPCGHVELLNPAQNRSVKSTKDIYLGPLFIFKDKYIVSCNDEQLYIVNPETLICLASVDNVRRILSMAVNKDEIFILEGDRSLIRIAYTPDCQINEPEENLMTKSLTNPIQLAVNTIKELTNLQGQMNLSDSIDHCDNIINETTISSRDDSPSVATAEECFELPIIRELPSDINVNILDKLMHSFIGDHDGEFDNTVIDVIDEKQHPIDTLKSNFESSKILHKPKKSKRSNVIDLDRPKNDSKEFRKSPKTHSGPLNERMEILHEDHTQSTKSKPHQLNISNNMIHLPENMSPDSIEKEIEAKEEILAKILDLEPVTMRIIEPPSPDMLYLNTDHGNAIPNLAIQNTCKDDVRSTQTVSTTPAKNKVFNEPPKVPNPLLEYPPKCVSIPNVWNLKEIKIDNEDSRVSKNIVNRNKTQQSHTLNTEELDDWELI